MQHSNYRLVSLGTVLILTIPVNGKLLSQSGKRKKWELEVKFTDTYDFDSQAWDSEMSTNDKAITILNNYAVLAQSLGAIVPYDVSVSVKIRFFSS